MKIEKLKKENGAISTLVLFTVLMFCLILLSVYLTITTKQKAQLKSDIRIEDLYSEDVERVDYIYNEIIDNYINEMEDNYLNEEIL